MRPASQTVLPRLGALSLAAVVLFVAGCGDSAKSSNHGGGRLSQAELIAKADPICVRFNARRAPVVLGSAKYISALRPLADYEWSQIGDLTRLTPPAAMEYDWLQMLNDARTIAEVTATLGAYAQANQFGKARPFASTAVAAERKLAAIAASHGFVGCARTV